MDKVSKSTQSERQRIEQLVAHQAVRVRRRFNAFLATFRTEPVRRRIRELLEAGRLDLALTMIDDYTRVLSNIIGDIFAAAAAAEVRALGAQVAALSSGIALTFNPDNPRAVAIMRRAQLEFIREFSESQRASTRSALITALQQGLGPRQVAQIFEDSIGLTEYQRNAVANYRAALERQDYAAALGADVRDRRFDSTLERLKSEHRLLVDRTPLGSDRIDRMVTRYRDRYLRYRAETIARTESHKVVNQARSEAFDQVVDQADIPAGAIERTWWATLDHRTRDTHRLMSGQLRGFHEPFVSPRGAKMMVPGDTSLGAPAEEVINCMLPGTTVQGRPLLATRMEYAGPVIRIETRSGRCITVTEKHPVLTSEGLLPAASVCKGTYMISHEHIVEGTRGGRSSPAIDDYYAPAKIEEVFKAFEIFGTARCLAKGVDFYGDANCGDGYVDIVAVNRVLLDYIVAEHFERNREVVLVTSSVGQAQRACYGARAPSRDRVFVATTSGVRRPDLPLHEFGVLLNHFPPSPFTFGSSDTRVGVVPVGVPLAGVRLGPGSKVDTSLDQSALNSGVWHRALLRKLSDGSTADVFCDEVVDVREDYFSGHVYDLQTEAGFIIANGMVISNCRCVVTHKVRVD